MPVVLPPRLETHAEEVVRKAIAGADVDTVVKSLVHLAVAVFVSTTTLLRTRKHTIAGRPLALDTKLLTHGAFPDVDPTCARLARCTTTRYVLVHRAFAVVVYTVTYLFAGHYLSATGRPLTVLTR